MKDDIQNYLPTVMIRGTLCRKCGIEKRHFLKSYIQRVYDVRKQIVLLKEM